MIDRYTPPAFAALWSHAQRYATWLEVELAACEAMEAEGHVPAGTSAKIRAAKVRPDPTRIEEIELTTRHDVIAFLTHVEQIVGEPARWLHRGMTSSDVLDTSFALLLARASNLLLDRVDALIEVLARRTDEHRHTVMIGRSHGMHAEPITFGLALAGHLMETRRNRERLRRARDDISVGKLSGAVGTYAHLSPSLERHALSLLGLQPETASTQVVARDRHAVFFATLAVVASGLERLATNVRHWQRTEVGEALESFGEGQKGSSAMPHKRNPILSENLCGLARLVRASVIPAIENVSLWHERDISHSSVERMIAPDATTTLAFMLERSTKLVEQLVVFPDRMRANLGQSKDLFFSEGVLLALVDRGLGRQDAYEIVQRCALAPTGSLRENLERDERVRSILSATDLHRCFDLDHTLRHVDAVIDRSLKF